MEHKFENIIKYSVFLCALNHNDCGLSGVSVACQISAGSRASPSRIKLMRALRKNGDRPQNKPQNPLGLRLNRLGLCKPRSNGEEKRNLL